MYTFITNNNGSYDLFILPSQFTPENTLPKDLCAVQVSGSGGFWGPGPTRPLIDSCTTHLTYCRVYGFQPRLECRSPWVLSGVSEWARDCLYRTSQWDPEHKDIIYINTTFEFRASVSAAGELTSFSQSPAFAPPSYAFEYVRRSETHTAAKFSVTSAQSPYQPNDVNQFHVNSCGLRT
jgi:hypothetical protein